MAISDVINKKGASAPAAAPAPAPKAAGNPASAQKKEAFQRGGEAERAKMTDDQKAAEGSKSDTLEFITCMCDPLKNQSRTANNESIPSKTVVGYKFRTTEPITYQRATYSKNAKSDNYLDVIAPVEVQAAAGETLVLNIVETAMLLSKVEYCGVASGGETPVILLATQKASQTEPTPILKLAGNKGSIKEKMEMIAEVGPDGKTAKIKEEYADVFGPLYARRKASKGGAVKAKKGEGQAVLAAAFRHLYSNKTNWATE